VGAVQDASRIPALPALPELEEPLAPEPDDLLPPVLLDPALEEALAPELLADPEPDDPPDSSHALARKRTAASARTNFSCRRIDREPLIAHGLPVRHHVGRTLFK